MTTSADSRSCRLIDTAPDGPAPHGLSAERFKSAFRCHPAGVALITADDGAGPVALTATSVSSVSVDPPLLVFSVSSTASSAPTITRSATVVVHFLAAAQLDLAQLGARSGIDRFADTTRWTRLATGEPCFPSVRAWIRGQIVNRFAAGTCTVCVVHALQCAVPELPVTPDRRTSPLVYYDRRWYQLDDNSRID